MEFGKKSVPPRTILPRRLRPGDAVRIVAPAGPVRPVDLRIGAAVLRSLDLRVSLSEFPPDRSGYLAGSDADRAEALNNAFRDPGIRAVFCARGGYGTPRILPRLDLDALRRDPKPVVGFSDITALLAALNRRVGLVAFHGPVIRTLSGDPDDRRRIERLLFSDAIPEIGGGGIRVLRPGTARGPVAGGNLSVLCGLAGTPFFPSLRGAILFLEEVGEPLYKIDRMLTQLRLSGALDAVAGLALGRFEDCGPPGDVDGLVLDRLERRDVPVLAGLPAGHGAANHPFPLGLSATLETGPRRLRFSTAPTADFP
jgi:muramoyltetrapeptide carboxypeptidase